MPHGRDPKASNEPLDIRDRGLTDVLGDADALSLWELLRRAGAPTEAAELAEAAGLPLDFVHGGLDRLVEAGLVEPVRATSRRPTPRWKALREVIVVGYRVGDPVDEVLIGCVNDLFGPERHRLIRSHIVAADPTNEARDRGRWSRVWAGRFPRVRRRRFWELVPELSRLYHASTARFLGMAPSRKQMCTHVIDVRLEPLHPGVPRLPEIWMLPIVEQPRGGSKTASAERWMLGGPRPSAARTDDLPLPARELEVARLIAAGTGRAEAADRLGISPRTVATHLRNAYRRLGVSNRSALRDRLRESGASSIAPWPRTSPRTSPRREGNAGTDSAAVIDLRSPGVIAALTSTDALAIWEHLRCLRHAASASEIARAFSWDRSRVDSAIERLAASREELIAEVPPRRRGGVLRWRTSRSSLVLGDRVGDRSVDAAVARLERVYREERRRASRAQTKTFEERAPDEEIYLGTQVGAFTADELERIEEILGQLESVFEANPADVSGEDDRSPWCDYRVTVEVEPLRPGILPQPTMNVVGQAWATDLAKRLDDRVSALSNRERTVALLLREGRDRRAIAEALGVSTNTVATLVKRLYAKLGVRSRVELAKRLGLSGDHR